MREFSGKTAWFIGALFVGFVVWSLYGAIFPVETYLFRLVHMGFIFALAFLVYPSARRTDRWSKYADILLAILGVATIAWAVLDLDKFIRRSTLPEPTDMLFGLLLILLLLELSRRSVGLVFTLVVFGFLLYTAYGNVIPGVLGHKGYDFERIVGHMYMTLEGVFGVPLSVSVSFVMLFVVYGTFMDAAGAGQFWLELAMAVMGRKSSSAGRGTVITTALLGGPQASGVATTMSVSPIMWPILKKAGYDANMAAGLISAGGIGAVISPPLMGAAAFLIMQFLGVAFWDVVVMVTLPTLLYYMGTLFMVDMEARKHNFEPPESSGLTALQVMRRRGYHLLSLVLLIVLLGLGRSPESAAIWGIAAVIVTSFLSPDRSEWLTPRRLLKATLEGAHNMLPVAILLAAAGLIVGTFSLTGLGLKISGVIMSASAGSVILALLLSLVASMIIGLSLPITATYIMTVIMVAPALVKVGVPAHVAHLLVFYFAVLSEVSPPVGLSPSAAAAVTGGNPFASMMQAWKYSLPAFLVPFFFAATPGGNALLIVDSNIVDILLAVITAGTALFFLAPGIIGYFRKPLGIIERLVLILCALVMVVDPLDTRSVLGVAPLLLGAGVLVYNSLARRPASTVEA